MNMALPCNNLNLNLYRVFYTVAKTKSFSESSRVLHISQPAISKHIQNLEYELDTLLFYRTNRGIELTPEARHLLTYVEKAYNFLMLGEKELQESKELTKGKISIGAPTIISINFINKYIKEFMNAHPHIIIKIANDNDEKLLELLYQHTLDMIIIQSNITTNKELKKIELRKERYCFAYSEKMNLKNSPNTLEELTKENLLLPTKNSFQRKKLEEIFTKNGLAVDPIMELESNETMLNYIKEGIGIGYILESVALNNHDLKIAPIDEILPQETFTLIYNENSLTISSKEFINILTKE